MSDIATWIQAARKVLTDQGVPKPWTIMVTQSQADEITRIYSFKFEMDASGRMRCGDYVVY